MRMGPIAHLPNRAYWDLWPWRTCLWPYRACFGRDCLREVAQKGREMTFVRYAKQHIHHSRKRNDGMDRAERIQLIVFVVLSFGLATAFLLQPLWSHG